MIDQHTGWYFVPASIKGVVLDARRVLLCLNAREEWELPGGWPSRGETRLQDTVEREVFEESGLRVRARGVVHAGILVVEDAPVAVVALSATLLRGAAEPAVSSEHSAVRFFDADALPQNLPKLYSDSIRLTVAGEGE